jgi:prepilin-type N-terminal cleavage/methylation domain-containing protein
VKRHNENGRLRRGFTMIEVIVALVVGMIVLGSVVQMLVVQSRGYRKQREQVDVRETAREAASLLSWDLRQAALGGSNFIALGANSVTLRSPRGVGTICGKAPVPALFPAVGQPARYGLWKTGGNITATVDDTALVYQFGRDTALGQSRWSKLKITAVGTPAAMGVPACAWPGARAPDVVVEFAVTTVPLLVKTDTSWIKVGAPVRTFRQVQYAEYQSGGRWWLGRKVGSATTFEQLTGPLLAPGATGGLTLTYYDANGAVTADPTAVSSVAFTLRTESYKSTNIGSAYTYQHDSLTTRVAVRR